MRNISIDRQDKSRSGFRVLDSPSCHRPGDSEERTAHNDSSPSCTDHRSTSSCVYTLFCAASKQKIMTMLMKRAKMMAVTQVGPDAVGQDVGLGGFRSQGPRLFHQPPTTPPPPAPAAAVHWLCGRTFWKCTRGDPLAGGSAGSGTLGLAATPSFGLHITAVITAHRNACSRHTYSLRWK